MITLLRFARRAAHDTAARSYWFDRFYTKTASLRARLWRRFPVLAELRYAPPVG